MKTLSNKVKVLLTGSLVSVIPLSAAAQITNTATVTGFYGATQVTAEDNASVEVVDALPNLEIVKTVKKTDFTKGVDVDDRADAGDTITYQYVVTNKGNVTLSGVTPVDVGPTFNGQTAQNALGGFVVSGSDPVANTATLKPNESATFEAVYVLANLDVYHAADTKDLDGDAKKLVVNTATSKGQKPASGGEYVDPDVSTVSLELAPKAEIKIVKTAVLNDEVTDNDIAEVDETITYTYTVTNTGNVPLTDISIADIHEDVSLASGDVTSEALLTEGPLSTTTGATSTDATANDGVWDILQPEAVITFTYEHTVTQDEVDNG